MLRYISTDWKLACNQEADDKRGYIQGRSVGRSVGWVCVCVRVVMLWLWLRVDVPFLSTPRARTRWCSGRAVRLKQQLQKFARTVLERGKRHRLFRGRVERSEVVAAEGLETHDRVQLAHVQP